MQCYYSYSVLHQVQFHRDWRNCSDSKNVMINCSIPTSHKNKNVTGRRRAIQAADTILKHNTWEIQPLFTRSKLNTVKFLAYCLLTCGHKHKIF